MTELYARIPLWLVLDGGVRALPAPARVALFEVAAAGGVVRCGSDPAGTLDAICAGAAASLDRMVDELGVLGVDGGRLTLLAPDGGPSTVGAARPTDAAAEPPPAAGPLARLKALFSKRGLKDAAARRAWLDSAEGRAHVARLGLAAADAERAADAAGRRGGRFGLDRPAVTGAVTTEVTVTDRGGNGYLSVGGNPVVTGAPSPAPPSPEKIEERSGFGARAAGDNPEVTGAEVTGAAVTDRLGNRPRLPTVERPADAIGALEVLLELRGAKLRVSTSAQIAAELDRTLAGVTPAWTRDGVRRLAGHIRDGHLRNGWRPTLDHLRGRDAAWATLLSLHDEAQGCDRCRDAEPARAPAAQPAPTRRAPPVFTEENRRLMEEMRLRRGATAADVAAAREDR